MWWWNVKHSFCLRRKIILFMLSESSRTERNQRQIGCNFWRIKIDVISKIYVRGCDMNFNFIYNIFLFSTSVKLSVCLYVSMSVCVSVCLSGAWDFKNDRIWLKYCTLVLWEYLGVFFFYLELHHRCWREQCDPFVRLGPHTKWWSVWTTLIPVRFFQIIQKTKLINLMIFFYYRKSFSSFKQVRSNIWRSQWIEKKFREETNWTNNNWKILWWTWKWFPKVCSLFVTYFL